MGGLEIEAMSIDGKEYKLTEEAVKNLKDAFIIGADIGAACFKAGITRQTYYNWIKGHPELKEEFDRLKEAPVMKAYQTVHDDLQEPETAKWYLERKRKEEFSAKYVFEQQPTQTEGELDREEAELEKRERDLAKRLGTRKNKVRIRKNPAPKETNPAPAPVIEGEKPL